MAVLGTSTSSSSANSSRVGSHVLAWIASKPREQFVQLFELRALIRLDD